MRFYSNRFVCAAPQVVCYDDPTADDGQGGGGGGNAGGQGKTFSQDDVNKLLADDRRKHQQRVADAEAKMKQTLESATLTAQQRDELQNSLDDLSKQLMTKDQLAAVEKKKLQTDYDNRLKTAEERATNAEKRYAESTISRGIADAAVSNDAFSVSQVVDLLRGNAKLVDDKVVIEFNDVHATTGEAIVTQLSPEAMLKRMKEMPERFGNLFKSNVNSGLGANGGGSSKPIDPAKLNPQQYREMRQKNPQALGF